MASTSHKPLILGTTFIASYAETLGLDAKDTLNKLVDEIGIRHFRLVSYWNEIESQKDSYDFTELDWQFSKIESVGGSVSLSLGLRQPRWPECHMPEWAKNTPDNRWQPQLNKFIGKVVERYKDSPALRSYQLENEFFNHFGECDNFDRQRLIHEFDLVKRLDPDHPVIISRSNNYAGFAIGKPIPDEFGISVYRRVWDSNVSKRYMQYPFSSWHYAFLAGVQKIITGKDAMLHELQTEAWPPNGQDIHNISLEEQNKSFNAERFKATVQFGRDTGLREIYLWGAEYWYYRLVHENDSSVWNAAKEVFKQDRSHSY